MPPGEVRLKPPGLHDQPPEPMRADHRIRMGGGTTMAIECLPSYVQQQKNLPPSTLEERCVDMLKKEGIRRREIGFFRGCFSASCRMVDEVHSVCQELML